MIAALPLVTSTVTAAGGISSAASSALGSAASAGSGDSFTSMLASMAKDTVDKLKTSEQMSIAGIEGKATTQSVVESVMAAQESLQTAIAVRDKAVSAYQDVTRMAI